MPVVTVPFPENLPGPQGDVAQEMSGALVLKAETVGYGQEGDVTLREDVCHGATSGLTAAAQEIIDQASYEFWEHFADEWEQILPGFPAS